MVKIVTTAEMKVIEASADKAGTTYSRMMENAGRAVAKEVRRHLQGDSSLVLILIGPGNNGGDGLVAARILRQEYRANVTAYLLKYRDRKDPVYKAAADAGVPIFVAEEDTSFKELKVLAERCDVLVDALLGTGIKLPLRGEVTGLLNTVEEAVSRPMQRRRETIIEPASPQKNPVFRPVIVAVDCPSGLHCDTGELDPAALKADVTVTFAAAKYGQFIFPGAGACGKILIADIRLPEGLAELEEIPTELLEGRQISSMIPKRSDGGHKTTFGRVMVVGGSKQYVGAPALTGKAAYRTGAGLVTLAVTEANQAMIGGSFIEAIWKTLPDSNGYLGDAASSELKRGDIAYDAVCIGPGLGWNDQTYTFLTGLLADGIFLERVKSLVLDADALNILSEIERWPALLPHGAIITPHPGEMARLMGVKVSDIESDRIGVARSAAKDWGVTVVLKGAYTVIASPKGYASIVPFATDALATAGTGDVLAGMIIGLLAGGMPPYRAAGAGAYLHAYTGLSLAKKHASRSLMASDLIDSLPEVWKDFD